MTRSTFTRVLIAGAGAIGLLLAVIVMAGLALTYPHQTTIGRPPASLAAETVTFPSASGSTLHGWFARGAAGHGAVILMHGVRANRLAMLHRALWLKQQGFSVLLFDFQAHGESPGQHITFGYREGMDAQSAVASVRARLPGEPIGIIGVSQGGAAALLAPQPLPIDALVLESVYPDIQSAMEDRLNLHLGHIGGIFGHYVIMPIFDTMMPPILGITPQDLRPIDHIGNVKCPIFVISGVEDAHTRLMEAQDLFAHAQPPRQFWAVPGAAHVDMDHFAPDEYQHHVIPFLTRYLVSAQFQAK